MLGPLPRLYRIIVAVVSLAVFVAAGTWAAYTLPYPFLLSVGAGVGLAVGGIAAFLLVHEHHAAPRMQPSRARRTRHH